MGCSKSYSQQTLLQNLVWPAAAGNVAWALFTLLVRNSGSLDEGGVLARALVLLLTFSYLTTSWRRLHYLDEINPWYMFFDLVHISTIVAFAIAVESNKPWLEWALCVVFISALVSHLIGAWHKEWPKRFFLAVANLVGLGVVLGASAIVEPSSHWHLSLAIFVVALMWYVRPFILKEENSGGGQGQQSDRGPGTQQSD